MFNPAPHKVEGLLRLTGRDSSFGWVEILSTETATCQGRALGSLALSTSSSQARQGGCWEVSLRQA
jgi:hypothetical protein